MVYAALNPLLHKVRLRSKLLSDQLSLTTQPITTGHHAFSSLAERPAVLMRRFQ
jgi:hypothetical protein